MAQPVHANAEVRHGTLSQLQPQGFRSRHSDISNSHVLFNPSGLPRMLARFLSGRSSPAGAQAPPSDVESTAEFPGSAAPASVQAGRWSCGVCTLENDANEQRCEACHTRRLSSLGDLRALVVGDVDAVASANGRMSRFRRTAVLQLICCTTAPVILGALLGTFSDPKPEDGVLEGAFVGLLLGVLLYVFIQSYPCPCCARGIGLGGRSLGRSFGRPLSAHASPAPLLLTAEAPAVRSGARTTEELAGLPRQQHVDRAAVAAVAAAATTQPPSAQRQEEAETREALRRSLGAARNIIRALPTITTTTEQLASASADNRSCTICLEDFLVGDVQRLLPCFHRFHDRCVDQWLQQRGCCPNCRTSLVG